MKSTHLSRMLSALALAGLMTGCASTFDARVSAFHRLTPDIERTYAFAPTATQRDSLEYRDYEQRMRQALAAAGFQETTNPALRVTFDWSVNEGVRTVMRTAPVMVPSFSLGLGFGGWRGGFGGLGFGFPLGWPYYGPGYATVPQAERAVEHRLRVEMLTARPPAGERVYVATAVGEASAADMPSDFPLLAQALLHELPGPTGRSRVIRVEVPKS